MSFVLSNIASAETTSSGKSSSTRRINAQPLPHLPFAIELLSYNQLMDLPYEKRVAYLRDVRLALEKSLEIQARNKLVVPYFNTSELDAQKNTTVVLELIDMMLAQARADDTSDMDNFAGRVIALRKTYDRLLAEKKSLDSQMDTLGCNSGTGTANLSRCEDLADQIQTKQMALDKARSNYTEVKYSDPSDPNASPDSAAKTAFEKKLQSQEGRSVSEYSQSMATLRSNAKAAQLVDTKNRQNEALIKQADDNYQKALKARNAGLSGINDSCLSPDASTQNPQCARVVTATTAANSRLDVARQRLINLKNQAQPGSAPDYKASEDAALATKGLPTFESASSTWQTNAARTKATADAAAQAQNDEANRANLKSVSGLYSSYLGARDRAIKSMSSCFEKNPSRDYCGPLSAKVAEANADLRDIRDKYVQATNKVNPGSTSTAKVVAGENQNLIAQKLPPADKVDETYQQAVKDAEKAQADAQASQDNQYKLKSANSTYDSAVAAREAALVKLRDAGCFTNSASKDNCEGPLTRYQAAKTNLDQARTGFVKAQKAMQAPEGAADTEQSLQARENAKLTTGGLPLPNEVESVVNGKVKQTEEQDRQAKLSGDVDSAGTKFENALKARDKAFGAATAAGCFDAQKIKEPSQKTECAFTIGGLKSYEKNLSTARDALSNAVKAKNPQADVDAELAKRTASVRSTDGIKDVDPTLDATKASSMFMGAVNKAGSQNGYSDALDSLKNARYNYFKNDGCGTGITDSNLQRCQADAKAVADQEANLAKAAADYQKNGGSPADMDSLKASRLADVPGTVKSVDEVKTIGVQNKAAGNYKDARDALTAAEARYAKSCSNDKINEGSVATCKEYGTNVNAAMDKLKAARDAYKANGGETEIAKEDTSKDVRVDTAALDKIVSSSQAERTYQVAVKAVKTARDRYQGLGCNDDSSPPACGTAAQQVKTQEAALQTAHDSLHTANPQRNFDEEGQFKDRMNVDQVAGAADVRTNYQRDLDASQKANVAFHKQCDGDITGAKVEACKQLSIAAAKAEGALNGSRQKYSQQSSIPEDTLRKKEPALAPVATADAIQKTSETASARGAYDQAKKAVSDAMSSYNYYKCGSDSAPQESCSIYAKSVSEASKALDGARENLAKADPSKSVADLQAAENLGPLDVSATEKRALFGDALKDYQNKSDALARAESCLKNSSCSESAAKNIADLKVQLASAKTALDKVATTDQQKSDAGKLYGRGQELMDAKVSIPVAKTATSAPLDFSRALGDYSGAKAQLAEAESNCQKNGTNCQKIAPLQKSISELESPLRQAANATGQSAAVAKVLDDPETKKLMDYKAPSAAAGANVAPRTPADAAERANQPKLLDPKADVKQGGEGLAAKKDPTNSAEQGLCGDSTAHLECQKNPGKDNSEERARFNARMDLMRKYTGNGHSLTCNSAFIPVEYVPEATSCGATGHQTVGELNLKCRPETNCSAWQYGAQFNASSPSAAWLPFCSTKQGRKAITDHPPVELQGIDLNSKRGKTMVIDLDCQAQVKNPKPGYKQSFVFLKDPKIMTTKAAADWDKQTGMIKNMCGSDQAIAAHCEMCQQLAIALNKANKKYIPPAARESYCKAVGSPVNQKPGENIH